MKHQAVFSGPLVQYFRRSAPCVAADEHGVLSTPDAGAVSLGEQLMLVPGHCDPTVNLYDELVCVCGGRVEAIWPIAARGALL